MNQTGKAQPAFRRVWADLRTQLMKREFPPGTPLPTEADIATTYSVSRQTVRRAFQDLVAEDLVFRVPGRGTFATPPSARYLRHFGSVEELMALSADSELLLLEPLAATVDPTSAARLRLAEDSVGAATFLRMHHGEAFCHTTVHLPPGLRERLDGVPELTTPGKVSRVTVIGLLESVLDAPIQDAEQSITVATAADDVTRRLELPPGTALLRIDRTYYDSAGTPVELAVSHFHPDRYSYRIRLRRDRL
jgi:GntR family transcriptional regulator